MILNHSIYKVKEAEGEKWLLIFHHNSKNAGFFASIEDAIYSKGKDKFSIFSENLLFLRIKNSLYAKTA